MTRYAGQTSVPVAKSQADLKKLIEKYGGDDVVIGESRRQCKGLVQFHLHDLPLQIGVTLPSSTEKRFHERADGLKRPSGQAEKVWKQACRQQWRVLFLLVKAQLVAVEEGLFKPEEAFLPWLLLPTGQTVIEVATPRLDKILTGGELPKLLMEGKEDVY